MLTRPLGPELGWKLELGKPPDRYRVVYVENMLQGPRASPVRWRIGRKLRGLIPAEANEEIGKGGDFLIESISQRARQSPQRAGIDAAIRRYPMLMAAMIVCRHHAMAFASRPASWPGVASDMFPV